MLMILMMLMPIIVIFFGREKEIIGKKKGEIGEKKKWGSSCRRVYYLWFDVCLVGLSVVFLLSLVFFRFRGLHRIFEGLWCSKQTPQINQNE